MINARNGARSTVLAASLAASVLAGVGAASAMPVDSVTSVRSVTAAPVTHVARAPSNVTKSQPRVQYSSPTVNGLRFRSTGSFNGGVRGLLYRGDRVQVIGWNGDWMHVKLTQRSGGGARAGVSGWVWKSYLYGPECRSYSTWPCTAWR
jgi:hypothetical protein